MSELKEWEKGMLDGVVSDLPLNEPYPIDAKNPHTTVKDILPDLTEQELDYVMSKYKGEMERG